MSQDKIEIECSFCQSLLRVDISHAGKRLRCPSCNNISDIPGQRKTVPTPNPKPTVLEPAFDDRPRQAATSGFEGRATASPAGQNGKGISGDVVGLATGIGGIVGTFICGCVSPAILLVCGWGLYRSFRSNGMMRSAAITTNFIAMAIAAAKTCYMLMFGF